MITSWTKVTERNPDHARTCAARWTSFTSEFSVGEISADGVRHE